MAHLPLLDRVVLVDAREQLVLRKRLGNFKRTNRVHVRGHDRHTWVRADSDGETPFRRRPRAAHTRTHLSTPALSA